MTRDPGPLLDACVHCGLCLESCPTYVETGLEAESPRGRVHLLRAFADGALRPEDGRQHLDSCLGCRACETACPSGVVYGEILESFRAAGGSGRSNLERFLVRHVLWRGRLAVRFRGMGSALSHLVRVVGRLPLPDGWRQRARLAPSFEPFRAPREHNPTHGPWVRVVQGCSTRALFPASEAAAVDLLRVAGYRVEQVEQVTCCGALAAHAGEASHAVRFTRQTTQVLSTRPGRILLPASGCAAHLAHSRVWEGEDRSLDVSDLASLLVDAPRPIRFLPGDAGTAVFQDPCHLRHGLGVTEAPREMLRRAGFSVAEPAEADLCCGSAGSYNVARPELAGRLGRRKRRRLRETGAARLVTDNPGCAMQLDAHAIDGDRPVERLSRVLWERMEREPSS